MWNFSSFADNIACVDEIGTETSYADLTEAAKRFSHFIKPRELVFSFCENRTGALIGYASFLQNKIVPLLLDAQMERMLVLGLIEAYKPTYLWLPDDGSSLESLMPPNIIPKCKVIFSDWGYSLVETGFGSYPLHSDLALLVTTSGSTGSPKLVRQSYKNIISNTESIVEYLNINASERPITTLPMQYVYGTSIINTHLSQGATILLTTKGLMQKQFWQFFKDYNATSIAGVPYTYEMLKKLRFTSMTLPSLKTMTQAGGKLHPKLHREFAEYAARCNASFVVMYGAAEATARMGFLPPERSLEKFGCMGIAIPGGRFEMVDNNGRVISELGAVGELVYYGDNVTLGYAENGIDLARGDERGGRYETGDMATCDLDGYYTIVGRKKRFLKIFGNRVSLDETEQILNNAFSHFECACAGVDDKMTVFVTDESVLDEVREFLTTKTGINHTAFKIVAIDKIPRNESGKTQYSELRVEK